MQGPHGDGQGLAVDGLLDAVNPLFRALIQLETLGHRPAARHKNADVGTLIAVVTRLQDTQEERFVLGFNRAAVIVEAVKDNAAIFQHLVDAGFGHVGADIDRVFGVFDHHLRPAVDHIGLAQRSFNSSTSRSNFFFENSSRWNRNNGASAWAKAAWLVIDERR